MVEKLYMSHYCVLCYRYIDGFDTKITRSPINKDYAHMSNTSTRRLNTLQLPHKGRPLRKCGTHTLSALERVQAHRYVLFNYLDVIPYLK
jgi:hypothetical protein